MGKVRALGRVCGGACAVQERIRRVKESTKLSLLEKVEALQEISLHELSDSQKLELNQFYAQHADAVHRERKWLELDLPEKVLISAPNCVQELISSHTAFFIAFFSQTVKLDIDDHPMILMNGVWTRWEEVKACVEYNQDKECFVSKDDPSMSWTYISPGGLVQKDPYPTQLYPIHTLTADELKALQAHAIHFWESHPEVDQDMVKPCVLQIFSTRIDFLCRNWFTEYFLDLQPRHVGIRLIDSKGNLYSFGLHINEQFRRFCTTSPWSMLATGHAQVVVPDFYETRTFTTRHTTSIPITNKRLEEILQVAGQVNQGPGERFCQLQPNCLSFVRKIVKMAGVEIDCRMTVSEMLVTAIPVVGKVYQAVKPVFSQMQCGIAEKVASVVKTALISLLMIGFGACQMVETKVGARLIGSLSDFLSEEKQELDHVFKLFIWQKIHHAATKTIFYHKTPVLNVI